MQSKISALPVPVAVFADDDDDYDDDNADGNGVREQQRLRYQREQPSQQRVFRHDLCADSGDVSLGNIELAIRGIGLTYPT